jgi:outer membrane receptor protein involved in Fe transport
VSLIPYNNFTPGLVRGTQQIGQIPQYLTSDKRDNLTPEVTLTYRPTDDLTAYISYKRGYKGPGFNLSTLTATFIPPAGGTPNLATISPFGPEKSEGVEGGVKTFLFDHQLSLNVAAYYYKYRGLQVSFAQQEPSGNYLIVTQNAASATVQGLELSATYSPRSVAGLTFSGNTAYNHSNYEKFNAASCYSGQSIAQGCSSDISTAGIQSLNGRMLTRAPRFTAQLGADYVVPVADNYNVGININGNFSSSYYTSAELNPIGLQKAYLTLDATLRLANVDDAWKLELIGRNLTDKIYGIAGNDVGSATAGVPADVALLTNRPREFMLRLTVRPENF